MWEKYIWLYVQITVNWYYNLHIWFHSSKSSICSHWYYRRHKTAVWCFWTCGEATHYCSFSSSQILASPTSLWSNIPWLLQLLFSKNGNKLFGWQCSKGTMPVFINPLLSSRSPTYNDHHSQPSLCGVIGEFSVHIWAMLSLQEFEKQQVVTMNERPVVSNMFTPPTANQSWRKVLSLGNLLNGHEPVLREIIFSKRDKVSGNHYAARTPSAYQDELETYRMYICGTSNDLRVALSVVSCD